MDNECTHISSPYSTDASFRHHAMCLASLSPPDSDLASSDLSRTHSIDASSYFEEHVIAMSSVTANWNEHPISSEPHRQAWACPDALFDEESDLRGKCEPQFNCTLNSDECRIFDCTGHHFEPPERMQPTKPIVPRTPPTTKRPNPGRTGSAAKVPHSAVEKKYRSNLNSKLIELQQCIPNPNLETEVKQEFGSPDNARRCNKTEVKLQKGLILSSAAKYIRTLQARNSKLEEQNSALERRLSCLQNIACNKDRVVRRDETWADCEHDRS